ncbi:MAG: biopolymer transporter ExbD [Bacteroidetes Order II. Incertae sedis bacterium]|nr:biopolymer transporter ExbD [Bacteroidetes Order II. bacterium]
MPKVNIKRKSTVLDMTAMVDVSFLLLTFFIMTTQFRSPEPIIVDTPSSISDTKVPDMDIMTISVDKEDKIYFTIDNPKYREALLDNMRTKYPQLQLNATQKKHFVYGSSVGSPISQLPSLLNNPPAEHAKIKQLGIPADSTNNELGNWIVQGRFANPKVRITVKADASAKYPTIKKVIKTLTERDINKFNLITDLEEKPKNL